MDHISFTVFTPIGNFCLLICIKFLTLCNLVLCVMPQNAVSVNMPVYSKQTSPNAQNPFYEPFNFFFLLVVGLINRIFFLYCSCLL